MRPVFVRLIKISLLLMIPLVFLLFLRVRPENSAVKIGFLEDLSFPLYYNGSIVGRGKRFNEENKKYLEKIPIYRRTMKFAPIDVTFVAYASSNHYDETRNGLQSIRQYYPKNKIIFYDLGLHTQHVDELKTICNMEIRKLNNSNYPDHFTDLNTYSFKVAIAYEAYQTEKAFWLVDSSVRFLKGVSKIVEFYRRVNNGELEPFQMDHPVGHSVFSSTDENMYKYLPISKHHLYSDAFQALQVFFIRSPLTSDIIKWWLLCALNIDCIAPEYSTPACLFTGDRFKSNNECHRFDQSALNIIMFSMRDKHKHPIPPDVSGRKTGEFSQLAYVERGSRKLDKIETGC